MKKLIEAHRLAAEGESIALVYKFASGGAVAVSGVTASADVGVADVGVAGAELFVSVSPEGARIPDQVWLPLIVLDYQGACGLFGRFLGRVLSIAGQLL